VRIIEEKAYRDFRCGRLSNRFSERNDGSRNKGSSARNWEGGKKRVKLAITNELVEKRTGTEYAGRAQEDK